MEWISNKNSQLHKASGTLAAILESETDEQYSKNSK